MVIQKPSIISSSSVKVQIYSSSQIAILLLLLLIATASIIVILVIRHILCLLLHQSRFREIHDLKCVFSISFSVSNSEVKPLLMTTSISINLHIQLIFGGTYHFSLQKISWFEYWIKYEYVIVVFL